MSKHTPGPWIWRAGYDGEVIDIASYNSPGFYDNPVLHAVTGDAIIGCEEYWSLGPAQNMETERANARLIATAPELLSIAKRWAAIDAGNWDIARNAFDKQELMADTRAAIAKAEGR